MSAARPSLFASLASVVDAEGTSGWKAEQCLCLLSEMQTDDPAVPGMVGAATAFALLSISEAIGQSGSGRGLVESIREAGGIQP